MSREANITPEPLGQIGPYRLISVLGKGGMGVVYLAEQSEPVRRTVALKVLKADDGSEQVLARFQAERQALAVMDHPSIAKIFDAGVTEDGHSYFAMERVEGRPINAFCDERRLSVRARVRLFTEVCRAVQHAHQKGLIHRDLKPSNVLVSETDGRPVPRIIDFGIAKAVEAEDFDGTRLTRDDQIIGTPAYMSPEQIEGSADVDTRSDIFSLGVLLYEVLVGVLPYDESAYRGWAAIVAALHREPPPPTGRLAQLSDTQLTLAELRSTTPVLLRKELDGDLDFIVARAMEKERSHRYESANGLALDLERFLADEPVRARGASTAYVLRKFVRRNRVGVAFAATVAVGLVAFAVTAAVQASRIAAARDVADARREQAEGLIDFMLSDLRAKLEGLGRLEILDDVGDEAMAYFASLPEEEFTDDELASRAQALYQIGSVRLDEGRSTEAREAFEASLRLARELSERNPDDADLLFGLSQSHFYVGYAAWLIEDFDGAEAEFLAYLEVAERLTEMDPSSIEYRTEVGYAQSNLGSVREARGDLTGAETAFEAALQVDEELARLEPESVDAVGELAEAHNHLAVVYRRQGRYREALEQHQRELALKLDALRLSPGHAYWQGRLAATHSFVADVQMSTGQVEEALENLDSAARIREDALDRDPSNTRVRRAVATTLSSRGEALSVLGRREAAEADLTVAVAHMRDLIDTDPARVDWGTDLASTLSARARARLRGGRAEFALRDAREARTLVGSGDGASRSTRATAARALLILGRILRELGQETEAVAALESARTILEALVAEPDGFEARPLFAEAYLVLGRLDEARGQLETLAEHGYRERALQELAERSGLSL